MPSSSEDEVEAPQRKKRSKRKIPEPDSDVDPIAPTTGKFTPDATGWSREVKKISVEPFGCENVGPTFACDDDTLSLEYFLQLFPGKLFKKMARYTNITMAKADHPCPPTSEEEIRAWFGIRLLMGLIRIPSYRDFWSNEPVYHNPVIARTMTRVRFDQLNQHLTCSNPADSPDNIVDDQHRYNAWKKHPLFPLQIVWDTVRKQCNRQYQCSRELAIDEAMVKYKGYQAKVRKFFMPTKPIRSGFKIYAMAESKTGYLCNFIVHAHGGEVKVKMLDIAMEVASTHLGSYHHIFTDKLYTSVGLARRLLSNNTYLTGAIKISSKDWPRDFRDNPKMNKNHKKVSNMRRMKRGIIYTRQNGQLTAVLWKDSKMVSLLSSAHQGYRKAKKHFVTRKVKDDGMRSRKEKKIKAPPQAISYLKSMGGVDRADQLRAYYSCSRKSQIWWRKLLYFLVDVCRVNAYICYKQTAEDPVSHSKFVLAVAMGLIAGFCEGKESADRDISYAQPVPVNNGPQHRLVKLSQWSKSCVWCRLCDKKTPSGRYVKSRSGCEACNVNLCKGECFTRYHAANWIDVTEEETETE